MKRQSKSTDKQVMEITAMDMVPFQFEGMALKEACWFFGKPYFSGQAIGEFLEYQESASRINAWLRNDREPA